MIAALRKTDRPLGKMRREEWRVEPGFWGRVHAVVLCQSCEVTRPVMRMDLDKRETTIVCDCGWIGRVRLEG